MANVNPSLVSLADHPRAARGIRTAKAAGGLVGFGVVAIGSWMHHTPLPDTLLRDKPRINVRFQAKDGREIATVYAIRLARATP